MSMITAEEEEEELRRKKLEETLEIKSLRRIISAYLNYPDAAEEDVKRYERSFKRLPPAHKEPQFLVQLRALALNSTFVLDLTVSSAIPPPFEISTTKTVKIEDEGLRKVRVSSLPWALIPLTKEDSFSMDSPCISKNSFFIFKMLQEFEPPLDMSQDIDICEEEHPKNVPDNHLLSGGRNVFSCQSASTSGTVCISKSAEASCGEGSNIISRSLKGEEKIEYFNEFDSGSYSAGPECNKTIDKAGGSDVMNIKHQATPYSVAVSNGNVSSSPPDWLDPSFQLNVPLVDVDKVRCIIRNIVRDWAAEGQKERDQCYKPILEELEALFPDRHKDSPPACLVPGAGLGRLALEISCLGFISQGNEFSYYMMICSSFILNYSQTAGEWTIYPWIHSNCNSFSDSDQLRPVSIPDIHPASAGITDGFSMCGGDFVEVYSDPSQVGVWDAVVTCFFLDTAHNIVEYIEIISRILKDGGVWINLGPLLYHFADMYGQEDEMSIELSLEDVRSVAFHYGFQLEKEKTIETTYTTNPRSMMQNRYYTAFWTMRKKNSGGNKAAAAEIINTRITK